ncbi:MAG: hypothetical protein K6C35_02095 [Eubacterium sp.]|nr:hypothetical protein [Eubacterium sp.]
MKKFIFLWSICVFFVITGCGKNELQNGNEVAESSVLFEGRFGQSIIDTSLIGGSFYATSSYADDQKYEYILKSSDIGSSSRIFFYSFSKSGDLKIQKKLDLPFSTIDGSIAVSDSFKCQDDLSFLLTYENSRISYDSFVFKEDGSFSSICLIYGTRFVVTMGSNFTYNNLYMVNWDSDGRAVSIKKIDDTNEYVNATATERFSSIVDDSYKFTESGVCHLNANGGYEYKYFDFINSGILSNGFDSIEIIDSNYFSGIYRDHDNNTILACFNRDLSGLSVKPLVLAVTELDDDIKQDIIEFNVADNGLCIAVTDYIDRTQSGTAEEAWYLLKQDLISGNYPDMVLNTTGYDKYFTEKLGSNGTFINLNNIINNDEELKSMIFTDKASSMYYSTDKTYSVVPSYYYQTIVGSDRTFTSDKQLGGNEFLSYAESVVDDHVLFYGDTRDSFIQRYLIYNGNKAVDYDNKNSSFSENGFSLFLNFAAKLPADSDEYNELMYSETNNGDYVLKDVDCDNIVEMHIYSTLYCKGDYVDLGFPVNGNEGSGVISASESFMLISGRKYTNECWSFIRQYLSSGYQDKLINEIPVTTTGYLNWKVNRMADVDPSICRYYYNGVEYNVNNPTDDEINYITDHIMTCNVQAFSDYNVEQIVLNYANKYFEGKMKADEAVEAIDKDIETYLNTY